VQATTVWTVARGRLAEADVLLACVLTWTILAFDRLRSLPDSEARKLIAWKIAFFGLLGATSLIKGIGFGAVLIVAVVGTTVVWDRDRGALRRLRSPLGWALAVAISLAWPLAMVARHGLGALSLWTLHVADRLAARPEQFAGEPWWQYGSGILIQALPWTPLVFVGAWYSLGRAIMVRSGSRTASIDRLLWAWGVVPLLLLSLATVKNAHYAIHAQVPWSIWGALGLSKLAERLQRRGWSTRRLRRLTAGGFAAVALAWGLGFRTLGPWLDRRGVEWAFYESAGRRLPPGEPTAFLYDDWDRNPYPTPFGPIPHDLAVRLYYLNRPACWHFDPKSLADCRRCSSSRGFAVIGRERDRPALERLGRVEVLADGPPVRFDRTYLLMRISPEPKTASR
jgi:4-amino-4-deoxy-L-arabinose transferase-like glycosyltransferase